MTDNGVELSLQGVATELAAFGVRFERMLGLFEQSTQDTEAMVREAIAQADRDRRFRRFMSVVAALLLVVVTVLSVKAYDVAADNQANVRHNEAQRCLDGRRFRADIYRGIDAVLDRIISGSKDPEAAQAVGDAAVAALKSELPQKVCRR